MEGVYYVNLSQDCLRTRRNVLKTRAKKKKSIKLMEHVLNAQTIRDHSQMDCVKQMNVMRGNLFLLAVNVKTAHCTPDFKPLRIYVKKTFVEIEKEF